MKFIRGLAKFFLCVLLLVGIYTASISWVNLWISQTEIGLLHDKVTDTSTIITPDIHTFVFTRAIPRRTTLLKLSAASQSVSLKHAYLLPGAELFSTFYTIPIESFQYDIEIQVEYIPASVGLNEYLAINGTGEFEKKLQDKVKNELRKTVSAYLVASASTKEFDSTEITASITKALTSLPLNSIEISAQTIRSPLFSVYKELESQFMLNLKNNEIATLSDTSLATNQDITKNNLMLYLTFINELSKLTENNPQMLEVIDRFSPTDLFASPQTTE